MNSNGILDSIVLTEFLRFYHSGVATNIFVSYIHKFSIIQFIVSTVAATVKATLGTFLNTNDFNSGRLP